MDCSPPGSSVHEISQVRILEWVAISFSRESHWTRDWTCVSYTGRQTGYHRATRVALLWHTDFSLLANVFSLWGRFVPYELCWCVSTKKLTPELSTTGRVFNLKSWKPPHERKLLHSEVSLEVLPNSWRAAAVPFWAFLNVSTGTISPTDHHLKCCCHFRWGHMSWI